ncbi:glycosyltransferase family 2 protein [Candidatus Pelagibacter sp. HIMB1593]|uniref:glycosyltransferase family 2 protein n=1 Tax=Candidatus Pelagibacter sp. HIMB1593 TaxID=3413355 RepID=UPI003F8295A2
MKVSIITATLNSEVFIESCLTSVEKQNYSDVEHIIIDGGSTDKTIEIINSKKKKNLILLSEQDKGIYDALNKGIRISTGSVIGILHADDIFSDASVLGQVVKIIKERELDILTGNIVFFDPKRKNIQNREITSSLFRPWMFRFGFMPAHTATFVKKNVFNLIGLYDSSFKSAGDFDFLLRLYLKKKFKIFNLNRTLVHMRTGGLSTSGIKSYIRTSQEILKALKKNNIYSNFLFVSLRLPFKQIKKWIFKLRNSK